MDFKDKVTLVTGGSRGIGRSICLEMAKHGSNIVINYNNNIDKALELKKEIEDKYKVSVFIVKADVSLEEEVKEMVESINKEFGKIDILVNNAGIALDTDFDCKTVDNFKMVIDVNLIGTFLVSKYVSKYMLEAKSGKIINISSTNGIDTYYPFSMEYDASKAGVNSLTKNLAVQLAPYINVNAVAPGWINTDMNKDLDKEFIDRENKKILLKRFANPNEVAKVVVFLASSYADYINSEIIRVDGGYYI